MDELQEIAVLREELLRSMHVSPSENYVEKWDSAPAKVTSSRTELQTAPIPRRSARHASASPQTVVRIVDHKAPQHKKDIRVELLSGSPDRLRSASPVSDRLQELSVVVTEGSPQRSIVFGSPKQGVSGRIVHGEEEEEFHLGDQQRQRSSPVYPPNRGYISPTFQRRTPAVNEAPANGAAGWAVEGAPANGIAELESPGVVPNLVPLQRLGLPR